MRVIVPYCRMLFNMLALRRFPHCWSTQSTWPVTRWE
jgi:hypothetical protein